MDSKDKIYDKEFIKACYDLFLAGFNAEEMIDIMITGESICYVLSKKIESLVFCEELEVIEAKRLLKNKDFEKILISNDEIESEILMPLEKCKKEIQNCEYYKYDNFKCVEEKINKIVKLINQKDNLQEKYDGKFPFEKIDVLTADGKIVSRDVNELKKYNTDDWKGVISGNISDSPRKKCDKMNGEPIISAEEFEKAQEILSKNKE